MHLIRAAFAAMSGSLLCCCAATAEDRFIEMPADQLDDKIRGGLLGQLFGNLNGIPHEFKYIDEPGQVETYTPGLPEGAWSDDDTDVEWIYLTEMERSGRILTPPARIAELWKKHINRYIWCANAYARGLMDLGIEPPLTGRVTLNPWSEFNISGQFVCESFALIAPAMPQTAAKIGLHYTHVTIDGEPAQATQLFTAMIATAFIERDVQKILDAGLAAVDPGCEIRKVVSDVRQWQRENGRDWRATRRQIRDKYTRHGGQTRDRNGHELNTAGTIGALVHGGGDFAETLRLAFNFGWDADNTAATAGTILGVVHGRKWMDAQGWRVKDLYVNKTRDHMPPEETITRWKERLVKLARQVIAENGGSAASADARVVRIRMQRPVNVEPLVSPAQRMADVRREWAIRIRQDLDGSPAEQARAAYLALCLSETPALRSEQPDAWRQAIKALGEHKMLLANVAGLPEPVGASLKAVFESEGLR
ncbi:MAG: hypothetical protein AMXMBFR13_49750 [Phycisphaerae bacterium]